MTSVVNHHPRSSSLEPETPIPALPPLLECLLEIRFLGVIDHHLGLHLNVLSAVKGYPFSLIFSFGDIKKSRVVWGGGNQANKKDGTRQPF